MLLKKYWCLFEFDQEVYFILKWILMYESISFEENVFVEENMVYWKIWYWLSAFMFMNLNECLMRIRGSHNLCDGPSHSIIDRAKVAIFHKKRVELELLQASKLVCLVICFDYLIDEYLIKPKRVILAQSVRIWYIFCP